MQERLKGNGKDFFQLSEEDQQRIIRKAFQEHAAFPNHPNRAMGRDNNSAMTLRFYFDAGHFCINSDPSYIDRFLEFLSKNNIDRDSFVESFQASIHDVVSDGNLIAWNRGWLDFHHKNGEVYDAKYSLSFGEYNRSFSSLTVTN